MVLCASLHGALVLVFNTRFFNLTSLMQEGCALNLDAVDNPLPVLTKEVGGCRYLPNAIASCSTNLRKGLIDCLVQDKRDAGNPIDCAKGTKLPLCFDRK